MKFDNHALVTTIPNTTPAPDKNKLALIPTAVENSLPRCDKLMQNPSSPFADGAFLTRRTTQVVWKMRHDGSRELTFPHTCRLKRYTALEAGKCLSKKSILFIGDSLTRYMYLSLAYFMERKIWPKRYHATGYTPCYQFDEHNRTVCSEKSEPNICCEYDWGSGWSGWRKYMQNLGGGTDGGLFHGKMEAKAVRLKQSIEEYQYVSSENDGRTTLTLIGEFGQNGIEPFNGWNFTGCAYSGTCRYTPESYQTNVERHNKSDFDWDYPNIETAFISNTTFRAQHQNTSYILYNRGLWGKLQGDKANIMMGAIRNMTSGDHATPNRCFYRSTTASGTSRTTEANGHEYEEVRPVVLSAGCEYFDIAHITEEFSNLYFIPPIKLRPSSFVNEYQHVFWDSVHYVSLQIFLP